MSRKVIKLSYGPSNGKRRKANARELKKLKKLKRMIRKEGALDKTAQRLVS